MVATLAKNGTGYNLNNRRSFGAWGEIRQGATTGAPKGRYCANLGHLDDDESGLTYMRARFYEPGSGRFVSEDRARSGLNFYAYADLNPICKIDSNGKSAKDWLGAYLVADLIGILGTAVCVIGYNSSVAEIGLAGATIGWIAGIAFFGAIGIWGAANTVQSTVELLNGLTYRAALFGKGDQLLEIINKMKSCAPIAGLAHSLEICAWLGIIDGA